MAKTICDWSKKDLENKQEKLMTITRNPCFFCRKCGRVANTDKVLCKAKRFELKNEKEQDDNPAL